MTTSSAAHPTVSPYIMAYGAPAVIDFMRDAFGGEVLLRFDREDGTLMHASVRIGTSVIMIADGTPEFPSFPVWLHIYVPDADAAYARALDCGASSVEEPSDKPDGDRRGGVRDVAGNVWWIGQALG